jgi:chromosome segregation ATPase
VNKQKKMEAFLSSMEHEWYSCQQNMSFKFLAQKEWADIQDLHTEWSKCRAIMHTNFQALKAVLAKCKEKKDYESQMLQINKCVEKMDSKFQNMDIKFQTLQTELIKLQNDQKDLANKIQDKNASKNIEMQAVNEQKLSDLKQQNEVQSIKSPYFSGKREENVEEWISYWESKFKPLERPKSEWVTVEKKFERFAFGLVQVLLFCST